MYSNKFRHLENHQRFSWNKLNDELDAELVMMCEKKAECIFHNNLAEKDYKTCKQLYKLINTSNML